MTGEKQKMTQEKTKERVVTMKLPQKTLNALKEQHKELTYDTEKSTGYDIIEQIHQNVLKVPRINKKMTPKTIAKKKLSAEKQAEITKKLKEAEMKAWEDALKD